MAISYTLKTIFTKMQLNLCNKLYFIKSNYKDTSIFTNCENFDVFLKYFAIQKENTFLSLGRFKVTEMIKSLILYLVLF